MAFVRAENPSCRAPRVASTQQANTSAPSAVRRPAACGLEYNAEE